MEKTVYSLCFMCSVRCPIKVTVADGQVKWIEGNPHVPGMEGSLCPKGAAGISFLYDPQRVQSPLIRAGERGEGKWTTVGWDEALDYVAAKLKPILKAHGGKSVALCERVNLATHVTKTFLKAIGSPNHLTHDALCKGSVNTACRSLFGLTDAEVGLQYNAARNIVLFGRNIFEAVAVREVNQLMEALANGAKLTYIDPRVTVTATKASRYWMIRPATDLALAYGLIHVVLKERLYDAAFVERWVLGLNELQEFVRDTTPEWAEKETGIPAAEIVALAREVSADKPAVIFHYGYRGAHLRNEIYLRRAILMLNVLMGNVEAKGGLFFKKGPGEVGGKAPRKLTEQKFPPADGPRLDRVGTPELPLPDPNHGVPQMLAGAILNETPYPVKALFINRFDALKSIPDTDRDEGRLREARPHRGRRRELQRQRLVSRTSFCPNPPTWSAPIACSRPTASSRSSSSASRPFPPRYDTRDAAVIFKQLGERLGIGAFFPYTDTEDLVRWQLEGTGFSMPGPGGERLRRLRQGPDLLGPQGRPEAEDALEENRVQILAARKRRVRVLPGLRARAGAARGAVTAWWSGGWRCTPTCPPRTTPT